MNSLKFVKTSVSMLKMLLSEKPREMEQSNFAEIQSYMNVKYSYLSYKAKFPFLVRGKLSNHEECHPDLIQNLVLVKC